MRKVIIISVSVVYVVFVFALMIISNERDSMPHPILILVIASFIAVILSEFVKQKSNEFNPNDFINRIISDELKSNELTPNDFKQSENTFVDMNTILSSFFSGDQNKKDCSLLLDISKAEDVHGCVKQLSYYFRVYCVDCSGSGVGVYGSKIECPKCSGKGQIITHKKTKFGDCTTVRPCKKCNGRGIIIQAPCLSCSGLGFSDMQEQLTVTIPPNLAGEIIVHGKGHYVDANMRGNLVVFTTYSRNRTKNAT